MLELTPEIVIISSIITLIILFYWDIARWKESKELYLKFKEKKPDEIKKRYFFRSMIKDYEKRENNFSWFRRRLIENNDKHYFLFSIFGNFSHPLLMVSLNIEINVGYIYLFSVFFILILSFFYKEKMKNFEAVGFYHLRSTFIYILIIISLEFFFSNELFRTVESSWHLTMAGISFSLATALFIIISLTPFLRSEWKLVNNLHDRFNDAILVTHQSIEIPSKFYQTKEFKNIYDEYNDNTVPSMTIKVFSLLIISLFLLGLVTLKTAQWPMLETDILPDSTVEDNIYAAFLLLIFATITIFLKFVFDVLLKPRFYDDENIDLTKEP